MQFKKNQRFLFLLFLAPLSIWLIFIGFRNEKDPTWAASKLLLQKDYQTLDHAKDSLGKLYRRFHADEQATDSAIFKLVSEPYLPTMTWEKFRDYFYDIVDKRSVIIVGVTGTGKTQLIDRIANVIAGSNRSNTEGGRKMEILCAPQFDLELHRRHIGYFDGDTYNKGELLKFWERCRAQPKERFVCLIDNFDKINPETFFGPELWQKLDDPKYNVVFGRDTVVIPENFYLLAITHSGVGQKIELNNEHLKRFGGQVNLPPTAIELVLYLKGKQKEVDKDLVKKQTEYINAPSEKGANEIAKLENQAKALHDTAHLQQFVYQFIKSNDLIGEKYSQSHQLGQWSDIRKNFLPRDLDNVQSIFLSHVNSFQPQHELRATDFDNIRFSMNTEGSLKNSSPFWKSANTLAEMGFASELGVAGSFALVSGIFGWFYFRRRHKTIKEFTERIYELMEDFTKGRKSYDLLHTEINAVKREFDGLVLEQKVNYSEAAFFYGFLEDKTRQIQFAREVNESFLKLVDIFLEDNVLTDSEYAKLNQFLESIKLKLSTPQYQAYKAQIEDIYNKYGVR